MKLDVGALQAYLADGHSQADAARHFNVSQAAISLRVKQQRPKKKRTKSRAGPRMVPRELKRKVRAKRAVAPGRKRASRVKKPVRRLKRRVRRAHK